MLNIRRNTWFHAKVTQYILASPSHGNTEYLRRNTHTCKMQNQTLCVEIGFDAPQLGRYPESFGWGQHYSTATLTAIDIKYLCLQPFYYSGTTEPTGTNEAPFESKGTISSAVSKMVTSGDLSDLGRSHDRFRLLQPFYI